MNSVDTIIHAGDALGVAVPFVGTAIEVKSSILNITRSCEKGGGGWLIVGLVEHKKSRLTYL